jgi:hypothetical protein
MVGALKRSLSAGLQGKSIPAQGLEGSVQSCHRYIYVHARWTGMKKNREDWDISVSRSCHLDASTEMRALSFLPFALANPTYCYKTIERGVQDVYLYVYQYQYQY